MLKCKRAAELISLQYDRPLSMLERWQLQMHLLVCSPCSRYRNQLNTISQAMRQLNRNHEND